MRKLLTILILGIACVSVSLARDFTYEDITYTVLDENLKTVETKAGVAWTVGEDTYYLPGNHSSSLLWLSSEVFDGDQEYTLTRIGDYSFYQNEDMLLAVIPSSVEEIGEQAFSMCTSLYGLTMPESATIGNFAFSGCISLSYITLPSNLETIPAGAFALCLSLHSIEIPSSVKSIEYASFMGSGLEKVVIPNNVTYINNQSFFATPIKELYLPSSLMLIGMEAFGQCDKLKDIYYNVSFPAIIFSDSFDATTFDTATLFVPEDMKSVIQSSSIWKNFNNITEADIAGIPGLTNEIIRDTEYFDINGLPLTDPVPGQIVIKRTGNKVEKIRSTIR